LLPRVLPPSVTRCQPGKRKARLGGPFFELRGKDSNLDYLIQSQASYR
jgi:hypothetical protein